MPTIVLGNNSTDDIPGLYLVELNGPDATVSFFAEDFARLRGNAHPILVPAGLVGLGQPGETIVSATLSIHRKVTNDGSDTTLALHPVLKPVVASETTWTISQTGTDWAQLGGVDPTDIDDSVQDWTVSNATPDAYRNLALNAGAIAVLQSIFDGSATYSSLMMLFAEGHEFDVQIIWDTAASSDGVRPYLTLEIEAGVGASAGPRVGGIPLKSKLSGLVQ